VSLNLNPMVLGLIERHMSSWTGVGATDVTMTYYDYILNYTRCIDLKYPELVLLSRLIFDRYLARNVKGMMMDNKTRKTLGLLQVVRQAFCNPKYLQSCPVCLSDRGC
jgi:hypothetical protein